ncbi:MAG TPA: hypothetical protein VMZ53_12320 [Kofleriaceae bacterium]|nr:hypothetical protein [Kofleriaceae bacterium]
MRLALLVVVGFVVGCGGAPARQAPPKELPVERIGDLAGRWVTSDDMDWSYEMTIDTKGGIDVWIDRGKMGRCEQKGTIVALADRLVRVIYTRGECNPQAVKVPIDMKVTSFTGQSLTVEVANQARTYQRASDDSDGKQPAVQLQP